MVITMLPMRCLVLLTTLSLCTVVSFQTVDTSEKLLTRHTRATMMIDMRGFPDTPPYICRGAGFQRNTTDCTQFYRCVDFNNNGKHTIFRFMCGPMAVFDESRSLCTGPELAVPACPQDQLDAFFVSMKPMDTNSPPAPIPASTERPTKPTTRPSTTPSTTPTTTTSTTELIGTQFPSTTTTPIPIGTEFPSSTTPVPIVETTTPIPIPETTTPSPGIQSTSTVTTVSVATEPAPSPTPDNQVIVTVSTTTTSSAELPNVSTQETTSPVEPVTFPPTSTPVTTAATTIPSIEVGEDVRVQGFIISTTVQNVDSATSTVTVESDTVLAILSQADGSRIRITEDNGSGAIFSILPPGTLLLITTTRNGGVVTNVANGLYTTSSTTTSFPPGTTFSIVKLGSDGQIISSQKLLTTKSSCVLNVPNNSFFGTIQLINQKVITISGWSFTTTYVTTGSTTNSFGVLQSPTSTSTSSQTAISTTSTTITTDQQFISGIITLGGSSDSTQSIESLSVPGGDLLAIIPQGGQGVITLIGEGSINSTDFTLTPGSILGVLGPSNGVGVVTNLVRPMYTSATTTITFPAGSTISIAKIGTNGQLVQISFVQVTIGFTLFTSVQSLVGIVQTNNDGVVSKIGTASFTIQPLDGPTSSVYLGVLNLNLNPISSSNQVQYLKGILQIGNPILLTPQQPNTNLQNVQILPNTFNGIILQGQAIITEQKGSSIAQTSVSIPNGGIIGIFTRTTGGSITDISSNYFTTNSTQITFPFGVRYGIVNILPNGTMELQNPSDTQGLTTFTVPTSSIFGLVSQSSQGVVTGIGSASFSTQNMLMLYGSTNGVNQLIAGLFGVVYFSEQFNLAEAIVISSSSPIFENRQTIAAIIQIGVKDRLNSIDSLAIPISSSFVIIPSGGQGVVTVTQGGSTSTLTVLPGQVFTISNVQNAKVTDIDNGIFTTSTTSISFGPGTTYGIGTINLQGQLVQTGQTAVDDITIDVATGSTVGIIQITNDNSGTITSIGSHPFAVKIVNVDSGASGLNAFVGILDIGSSIETVPSTTDSPVSVASTTPETVSVTTQIISSTDSPVVTQAPITVPFVPSSPETATTPESIPTLPVTISSTPEPTTRPESVTTTVTSTTTETSATEPVTTPSAVPSTTPEPTTTSESTTTTSTTSTTDPTAPELSTPSITTPSLAPLITPESTATTELITTTSAPTTSTSTTTEPTSSEPSTTSTTSATVTTAEPTTVPIVTSSSAIPVQSTTESVTTTSSTPQVETTPSVVVTSPAVTTIGTPITQPDQIDQLEEQVQGFITIGADDLVQGGQQTPSAVTVPAGSVIGVVSQGSGSSITITDGSTDSTFTIPPGAILMINTTQNGGVINNVANGLYTTSSTTTSFPPGTTFSIVKLGSNGQIVSSQTLLTTTSNCVLNVPNKSFFGMVQLFNQKVVSIGGWSYTTTYVTTGSTISSFGVLQSPVTSTSSQTVITTTSTTVTGDQQFISGIITAGGSIVSTQPTQDLVVPNQNLLAVIPSGGRGTVTLVQGGSTTNYTITPGSFIGITAGSQGGLVTNVNLPSMTTSTTSTITFPAGSSISVFKIGIDGKLISISSVQLTSAFTIITSFNSIVGLVQTTSSAVLTNIGTGTFSTQTVSGSTVPIYYGILNFNSIQTSQVETLSGFLQLGSSTFLNSQGTTSTSIIPANTTTGIVATGSIVITEEDGTTTSQSTLILPTGGLVGMITSATGGQITALVNGYFTTDGTQITFQSGVTVGMLVVLLDGTVSLQNSITTRSQTTIVIPTGSVYGLVRLSDSNVLTGIGSASFNTQQLLLKDSTGSGDPALLANFGVLHFTEQFQLLQSIVISSTPVSAVFIENNSTSSQIISTIIQLGLRNQYTSISSLAVPGGSQFAIIPATGQGEVSINDGGSQLNFTILPGQLFVLSNIQGATVNNIGDGFFTTSSTTMFFGSGTTYDIKKIVSDGSMFSIFSQTSQSGFSVTVQSGSTVGIIQSGSSSLTIGGASLVIRTLTTSSGSQSGLIGILDIGGFLSQPATTAAPTTSAPSVTSTTLSTTTSVIPTTPQPPTSTFAIDCALNELHQFPLDCSRFYQCFGDDVSGTTVYIFPCAPGLIFDDASSQCLTSTEATCDDSSSVNETADTSQGVGGFFQINCSGELYRYPLNCNNFYQCFKNEQGKETIFIFSCNDGLVFDETSRRCLLPSETASCATNDNLFRAPSLLFQLKQKIDITSLTTSTRTILRQRATVKSSSQLEPTFSLPHQTVRGSTKRKMGYNYGSESDREAGQRRIAQTTQTETVTQGKFRQRLFDSGNFGARIAPRSKTLFGLNKQE